METSIERAKEHRDLVGSISKGDEVMTSGGLLGKVTKVNDEYIAVEISDGVQIKLQKVFRCRSASKRHN